MKKHLALALVLATAPLAASAGELSYSYVEAAYSEANIEFDLGNGVSAEVDLDGYALKGSMAFTDNFYGAIGMHEESFDSDNSLEPWEMTLGYNKTLGKSTTDFVGEVSYIGMNSTLDAEDFHNDGFRAAAGVRAAVGKHVELGAKLTYTSIENFDSLVGVNLNGQVKFNQTWGIVGQYHYNEYNFLDGDVDSWQIGVRASF